MNYANVPFLNFFFLFYKFIEFFPIIIRRNLKWFWLAKAVCRSAWDSNVANIFFFSFASECTLHFILMLAFEHIQIYYIVNVLERGRRYRKPNYRLRSCMKISRFAAQWAMTLAFEECELGEGSGKYSHRTMERMNRKGHLTAAAYTVCTQRERLVSYTPCWRKAMAGRLPYIELFFYAEIPFTLEIFRFFFFS